ncbi:hypothetical protein OAH43_00695 [bacterium]|nr:hypothetical protein [bacterium]
MSCNLSKCFKYYEELDDDLKNIVLSKVRNPQNKELLNDIVSYKKQKDIIYEKYLENERIKNENIDNYTLDTDNIDNEYSDDDSWEND